MLQIYTAVILSFILFFSTTSMDKPTARALHPEDFLSAERMLEASPIYDNEIFELDSRLFSAQSALCQNIKFGTRLYTALEEILQLPLEGLSNWKKEIVKHTVSLHDLNTQSARLLELLDKSLDNDDSLLISLSSGCIRKALNKHISSKNNEYAAICEHLRIELMDAHTKITITPLVTIEQIQTELSTIIPTSFVARLMKVTEFAYAADKTVPTQEHCLQKIGQLQALFGIPKKMSEHPACTYSEDARAMVLQFCKTQSLALQKKAIQTHFANLQKTTKATEYRPTLGVLISGLKETVEQTEFFSNKSNFITTPFRQSLNGLKKSLDNRIKDLRKHAEKKQPSPRTDEDEEQLDS